MQGFDFGKEFKKLNGQVDRDVDRLRIIENKRAIIDKHGLHTYGQLHELVRQGVSYDAALQQLNVQLQQQQVLRNPPPLKGSARWADWQELNRNHLLGCFDERPSSPDIFLGMFDNPDPKTRPGKINTLYYGGESHLMMVAPTGAGKSTSMLIPNLLQYEGSCLVFDPKGELYRATSYYRSKLGKVYRLAPFEENTHAFNPLDQLKSFDDALEFAQVIFPPESTGDGAFYENEARSFLAALIYFIALVGKGKDKTIAKVRAFMSLSTAPKTGEDGKPGMSDFDRLLHKMATTESLPTPIKRAASLVMQFNAQTRTTLLRSLNEKLQIWDSEALERATCRSDFQFADMKRETVTIYLTVPFNRIEAYSYYVRAMLTFALEAMVADDTRPKVPVLFILDEFLRLGRFQRFIHALRTHRDAGVRLWFVLQSIADMQESYPDNWRSFFTATEVKIFFGIRDHFTAQTISEMLGDRTHAYQTTSTNSGQSSSADSASSGSSSQGASQQIQFDAKPLLAPNEVQNLLGQPRPQGWRNAIVLFGGVNPALSILLPWYQGQRGVSRYGSVQGSVTPSPLLWELWHGLNRDIYDGALQVPEAIGYQDYSMGRDGWLPSRPATRALHEPEFNRIILMQAVKPLEDAWNAVHGRTDAAAGQLRDAVFSFLAPLLAHEMMHQWVVQKYGDPAIDHGAEFLETARGVHRKVTAGQFGFDWPEPTEENITMWPLFVNYPDMASHVDSILAGQVPAAG